MEMRVNVNGSVYIIDDEVASYSPLLNMLMNTTVPVDKDLDGNIILDIDHEWFRYNYLQFLKHGYASVSDYVDAARYNKMGHTNNMNYPIEIWGMKLRDNWIRDHFYSNELYNTPLYGLHELRIMRSLPINIPKGWYVAGGAALWMTGIVDKFEDIDLFTSLPASEADESMKFLLDHTKYDAIYTGNVVQYHDQRRSRLFTKGKQPVQMILRRYRSLSETLHGFDVDCVGIAYVPQGTYIGNGTYQDRDALYLTDRALTSIKYRTNWLDPMRASPSYPYRLIKYKNRGFNIYTPMLSYRNIDYTVVQSYMSRLRSMYIDIQHGMIQYGDDTYTDEHIHAMDMVDSVSEYIPAHILLSYIADTGVFHPSAYNLNIQCKLILAAFFNMYIETGTIPSDYGAMANSIDHRPSYLYDLSTIQWLEQNPMDQLSATINPMPIDDIRIWYSRSPFYKE